jgi:hypothetical protein
VINGMAMRRDPGLHGDLRERQYPTVMLPWYLESDDPKDPEQIKACDELTKIIKKTPRLQHLRLAIHEDRWYGRAGAQVCWDKVFLKGRKKIGIVDHLPVNGDKIGWHYDGTPKISVNAMFVPERGNKLIYDDYGAALLLTDPYYRERFIISQFEPTDADFAFESEKAMGVHGLGLRDRLYWAWFLKTEVMSWMMDALQRVGVNGMMYGFYESGNASARNAMIEALQMLVRDNISAFPQMPGSAPADTFQSIPPATIGYEVLFRLIEYLDGQMRKIIIGQTLSSDTGATGMGSGVAQLHESTKMNILRADAADHEEALTTQLLGPMIRMNYGELDFDIHMKMQVVQENATERMMAARSVFDMGIPLDREDIYEASGFGPPKDGANVVELPKADVDAVGQGRAAKPQRSTDGMNDAA